MNRMPRPVHSPRMSPMPIDVLIASLRRFQEHEAEVRAEYPWANRFVMGMPLAPWQREFKWGDTQCERFITSAWTGVPLGFYVLTEADLERGNHIRYQPMSNCVLDGQQRLHALELYLTDQLAVPDANGEPVLWGALSIPEQRWFAHRIFDRGVCPLRSETELRQFYDLVNFGGTPHEEHERAVPRPRVGQTV